jgi:hypothetical protein
VPRIGGVDGWIVWMHFVEDEGPHIHVKKAEEGYRFSLRHPAQMPTDIRAAPAGLARQVVKWIRQHRRELLTAWNDCQHLRQPRKIKD